MPSLSNSHLPRLLYLSDVPVEKSYHGSVLLYRLLEQYTPDKLRVIEGNIFRSQTDRRLPGVAYRTYRQGWARLQYTRFFPLFAAGLMFTGNWRTGRVERLLEGFVPEAVLTVTYFYSWTTAAALAAKLGIPLHLILHDECIDTTLLPKWAKPHAHRIFGNIYRQAASRLCVSPFMAEEYSGRYRARGEVLFPCRAADAQIFPTVPGRMGQAGGDQPLVVAFGGTVNCEGTKRALAMTAKALEAVGGKLKIFGPIDAERARANGLGGGNIEFRGSLNSDAFKQALRNEADVLLVPMNFDPEEATNTRISFPSKLADYTSVGLPMLIFGPDYCSGVRWARDNAPVAEVVAREDAQELTAALERLRLPEHRQRLAHAALRKGDEFFAHARAAEQFLACLRRQPLSRKHRGLMDPSGVLSA